MANVGNLQPVASTAQEMFGNAAYVAAGHFGDGIWTNLGLPMRVSIKVDIFNQNLQNEVGQIASGRNAIIQSAMSGTVTLTLRRHNKEQIVALFPGITKRYFAGGGMNGGYGWDVTPASITPVGLHVRPNHAYGVSDNNPECWWVASAVAQDVGEWISKVENTDSANEDFPLTFRFARIDEDYTPGTPQPIASAGRLLYQGDTRHIVANSWEEGLAFGFRAGYAGRVESFGVKSTTLADTSVTMEWTAPGSEFIDSTITNYLLQHRVAGTTGAFTEAMSGDGSTLELAVTSLSASTAYEFRVAPVTSEGNGQFAVAMVTTTA